MQRLEYLLQRCSVEKVATAFLCNESYKTFTLELLCFKKIKTNVMLIFGLLGF